MKQYKGEFLSEFEILDEDANTNSYDLNTQMIIDRFSQHFESKLFDENTEADEDEV